jgi:3-oxoacyl-[acyl-carrier protein] reductase
MGMPRREQAATIDADSPERIRQYLVIGANGGLGRAICSELQSRGSQVVGLDLPHIDLKERGTLGPEIERLWKVSGPFDGLVHAAGLYPAEGALTTTEELFDELLTVNARSALVSGGTLARLSIATGMPASLVFVSSVAAVRPQSGTVAYSASKAALEAIVRGLALETGPFRIRVNAVAPGFIKVDSAMNPIPEKYVTALAESAPQGRVATPEDIVPAVLWLLSDAAQWVNGQVLAVDGGSNLGASSGPNWL